MTKSTLLSVNIGGRVETKRTPESGEDQNQLFRKLYWAVPFAGAGIVDGKESFQIQTIYHLQEQMV